MIEINDNSKEINPETSFVPPVTTSLTSSTPESPVSSPASSDPTSASPQKSKKWPWTLFVLVSVVALFAAYWFGRQSVGLFNNFDQATSPAEQSKTEDLEQAVLPYDRHELLFTTFIPDPTGGGNFSYQAWLLDLNDGSSHQLELPNLAFAFKHPRSSKVFFAELYDENIVKVKDLRTDETKQYEVITHPQADVREGVTINDLKSVAPDGSMIVYSVFFTESCPPVDFDSLPPGFEGGFGPCEPDPDPNFPSGYYLYDFQSQTNTHLGGVVLPAYWDLANHKMYFNDIEVNRGLNVIDLNTKQISIFDQAQTFGYGAFPMLDRNYLVKVEGQTGNVSGQDSSSALSLTNLADGSKKVLDSGEWASIQHFVAVAPDESKFLYLRTTLDSQGRSIGSLHLYDMNSGSLRQVTPVASIDSYDIHGYWMDNNNFITLVNESGANFDNTKNSLVKINVLTGTIQKLSDQQIYRFIRN